MRAQDSSAAVADATFECTKCRAVFPWSDGHVGRLCRCACGQVLKVPAQPREGLRDEQVEQERIGIREAPDSFAKPQAAVITPTARAAMTPPPVPADASSKVPNFLRMSSADPEADKLDAETEAILAETGKFGEDPDAHVKPDPRRNLHVPIALLAAGLILTFIDLNVGGAFGAVVATLATGITLVISTVLFLAGGLLAARFGGVCLGELGPALLKLAAVGVFPAALADLVTKLLGGDMAVAIIGNGIGVVTCWSLVSYLFRLDGAKTMSVVIGVAVVKLVSGLFIAGALGLLITTATGAYDTADESLLCDDSAVTSVDESDESADWDD